MSALVTFVLLCDKCLEEGCLLSHSVKGVHHGEGMVAVESGSMVKKQRKSRKKYWATHPQPPQAPTFSSQVLPPQCAQFSQTALPAGAKC